MMLHAGINFAEYCYKAITDILFLHQLTTRLPLPGFTNTHG